MTDRELLLRVTIENPPPHVEWALQLGRTELQPPTRRTPRLEFEVAVTLVRRSDGATDFRGPAVQGPRGGRFLYLNSGRRAGQATSPWDRRAKVSLEGLRAALASSDPARATMSAASIAGTHKDGGPACASVPLLETGWRLSRTQGQSD